MCDCESVAKSLRCCASDSEPCEHCNCELEECNPKTIMEIAADAIEELLAENKAIKQSNKDDLFIATCNDSTGKDMTATFWTLLEETP